MAENAKSSPLAVALCWAQGLYFLATGAWPLLSVETFQRVTGQKSDHLIADPPTEADHWMLNTISALIIVISLVILTAAWRRRVSFDVSLLGVMSAAALAIIDVVYVARGTIWPIYLADAAVEVVIIAAWTWLLANGGHRQCH
ncbi:MAG: hypothetical protein H0T51_07520 [Pirellulales bacterium]|nr:hypothetical protein [Pirellulales bacterium]